METLIFNSTVLDAVFEERKITSIRHFVGYYSISKRLEFLDKGVMKLREIHDNLLNSLKEVESFEHMSQSANKNMVKRNASFKFVGSISKSRFGPSTDAVGEC